MKTDDVRGTLYDVAGQYPDGLKASQHRDVERVTFHIELVVDEKGQDCSLCDIGGGLGLFSVGCAALGMRVTLVDDFQDEINRQFESGSLAVHRKYKVNAISKNAIEADLEFPESYFDIVTSFDSMEHWHHSPRRLFHEILICMKSDALFVLGVPNCVNFRKRITVPFGKGKWSQMQDWYKSDTFRGHVREPDVPDLEYIASDMQLKNYYILGRNWLGYRLKSGIVREFISYADHLTRIRPLLCSDICLGCTRIVEEEERWTELGVRVQTRLSRAIDGSGGSRGSNRSATRRRIW